MNRYILSLILLFLSFGIFAGNFDAKIKVDNPSDKINDGVAFVEITDGIPPFQYKWNLQHVPLSSNHADKLTEGETFEVIITDAEGSSKTLTGKVPIISTEERINKGFKPIVKVMNDLMFADPFSYIGIYDPVVYADLKNVKAQGWANPEVSKIDLKEWLKSDGEKVKKGDLIAIITQDDQKDIEVFANADGTLEHKVEAGKVIFDATNIQDVIHVGAENLATIIYDTPQPVLHPNGDKQEKGIPFIVVWLVLGAIFFTVRMRFINARGVKHAFELIRGKFDDPKGTAGEVSHFQALTTALSATVGLGNIC